MGGRAESKEGGQTPAWGLKRRMVEGERERERERGRNQSVILLEKSSVQISRITGKSLLLCSPGCREGGGEGVQLTSCRRAEAELQSAASDSSHPVSLLMVIHH